MIDFGDERARTADPLLAKQMLYQLSYIPERRRMFVPSAGNPTNEAIRYLDHRRTRVHRREYRRVAGA
jgi:hypothetical protein